ncbi:MAG: hypothetical protein U0528_03555 [Anaerolineae bacterium]
MGHSSSTDHPKDPNRPEVKAGSLEWLVFSAIIALALLVRLPYLPVIGYLGDLEHFASWGHTIAQHGLFRFYDPELRYGSGDRAYPPLSTVVFATVQMLRNPTAVSTPAAELRDSVYVILLKLAPFLCEMGLIAAAYLWLRRQRLWRWLIPCLLAIYPGLLATTVWWGQYESAYLLFVVLALIALNRDQPILAWVSAAIGLLFKQPAVIVLPLLVILTFRRYGWRKTLIGLLLMGAISLLIHLPFMLASGPVAALSPYLNASDAFPNLSNNAWNFWFFLGSLVNGAPIRFQDPHFHDAVSIWGLFSYKTAGLLMFGTYSLLLLYWAWRNADKRNEFIWATALYFGFFMLPTQVHERYLYPVAVISVLALAQDWRMIWIVVGVIFTYSYNILGVAIPYNNPRDRLGIDTFALPTAFLNIMLFIGTAWITRSNRRKTIMSAASGANRASVSTDNDLIHTSG